MDESQELDLGKLESDLKALSFNSLTRICETVLDIDEKFQIYKPPRLETRIQPVSATPAALKTSAGVWNPRHFLGR